MFRSIASDKSVTDSVIEELQQIILSGKIKEGEKLPSERELSQAFNVSRSVVREAVKVLQVQGMVQVRPGIGTIVKRPSAAHVVDGLSLLIRSKASGAEVSLSSIHEVRTLLEIDIVELAAERATAEDIAELRKVISRLALLVEVPGKFLEVAIDFHRALAEAAHNPLLLILFDSVQEITYAMRQRLVPRPIAPEDALAAFQEIVRCIEQRDPEGASVITQRHLAEVWISFAAALRTPRANGNIVIGEQTLRP